MKWTVKLTSGGIEAGGQVWRWGADLVRNQEILDKVKWEKVAEEFYR